MARRAYGTRFKPAPGFETIVMSEISGVGARVSGQRGRDETKLNEIGEYIVNRARDLASEPSRSPARNTGGLRRARLVGTGQIVPRHNYDFRREREGQKPYLTSFLQPVVKKSGDRVEVTVVNISPAAQMVEEGTGAEGQPIHSRTGKPFRMPITKRAYNRISKMSLAERRKRGLVSGDPLYRKFAMRELRARSVDPDRGGFKQIEKGGLGSKKALRTIRARRIARATSSRPNAGQIRRQTRGYQRRFVYVDHKTKRIMRTREFTIKRTRYLTMQNGRAYLGTTSASRYRGYGIFLRAMNDAVRRFF